MSSHHKFIYGAPIKHSDNVKIIAPFQKLELPKHDSDYDYMPHIAALPGLKSNIAFWKDFFAQQSLPFPEQLTVMDYQHKFVYQNVLTLKI